MNQKPESSQLKMRTVLLLLIPVALVSWFGADRYMHSKERQSALASLAKIGLNHEFDADGTEGNQIVFYSTSSDIDPSKTSEILGHLKSISREYNNTLRFAYDIQRIDFQNSKPDATLIEELHGAFPKTEIRLR